MLNFKKFNEQHQSLLEQCRLSRFDNLEEWFKACVSSKGFFKNKIGSNLKGVYELEVEDEVENKEEMIPPIMGVRQKKIEFPSRYVDSYGKKFISTESKYTIDDFKEPKLPDGRRSMKVFRKILEKAQKKNPHADYSIQLQSFYNSLQRYYDQNAGTIKFPHEKYEVTISCDPIDFLQLGHRHCDQGTCFSNGRRGLARYKIATARNSFVMLVRETGEKDENRYIGRCWGFYNYQKKTWHITNMYAKEITKEAFVYLIKVIVDDISDTDHDKVQRYSIGINSDSIYNNNDGIIIGLKKNMETGSIDPTMKFSEPLALVGNEEYGTVSIPE